MAGADDDVARTVAMIDAVTSTEGSGSSGFARIVVTLDSHQVSVESAFE